MLKPEQLSVKFANEENVLKIILTGSSDRMIRIVANNFMDNLKTVVECMENFDNDAQEE